MDAVSNLLDEFVAQLTEDHQEALDELGELWRNHTGPFADYDLSLDGLHNLTTAAAGQFVTEVTAFYSAVDWSEHWIMGILSLHGLLWLIFLVTCFISTSVEAKVAFFSTVAALCGAASFINDYGSANWQSFAKQNYFDDSGLFLAVVWCIPLLGLLVCILLQLLWQAVRMMVQVKVRQIKARRQRGEAQDAKTAEEKKND